MNAHDISGAIVVGVDGSHDAAQAIRWGAERARSERRPLVLAHVVNPSMAAQLVGVRAASYFPDDTMATMTRAGQDVVEAAESELRENHRDLDIRSRVAIGDPRRALLDLAQQGPRVLVVGSRGHGPILSALAGSVSIAVAREARCPVVVVRPHNAGRVRNGVLVGIDLKRGTRAVLEHACAFAASRALPVTVVHCLGERSVVTAATIDVDDVDERDSASVATAEAMAGLAEDFPDVPLTVSYSQGIPWQALVRLSASMDLVVVGRHEKSSLIRVIEGDTASSVVEHAECPVMVIPGESASSPFSTGSSEE